MALNTIPLPYGLRDVKLHPYTDLAATVLAGAKIDLPYAQTYTFRDTEEYTDLRGDDKLITSHGQGSQINWTLASGGVSLEAYAAMAGGTVNTTGVAPNQIKKYKKNVTNQRPFFLVEGQSISDSGGDVHGVVYLCRATGEIGGDFADGQFFITNVSGLGFPARAAGLGAYANSIDDLYDFVQNETITAIS
jgi:hypothetical protein